MIEMLEAPDFDPELKGHSAVVRDDICHTVVSDFVDGEYRSDLTECGIVLGKQFGHDIDSRGTIADKQVNMCPQCWPECVVNEDLS